MNRDDIVRWAQEANLPPCHTTHPKALERFANLVAAAEREACAEVCELMYDYGWLDAKRCAREIRARGEV